MYRKYKSLSEKTYSVKLEQLSRAISNQSEETVRDILNSGFSVKEIGSEGTSSPLHIAAKNGNINILESLLDAKANINARNDNDITPIEKLAN